MLTKSEFGDKMPLYLEETMVKYNGLTKAEVLCALYNNAKGQGLGMFMLKKGDMTIEQAENLLKSTTSFDYIQGRVLKVDLSGDVGFEEWLYDRDNGEGKAQQALDNFNLKKNNVNSL